MHKVDLHTHSQASPDGGLTLSDYRTALESGRLDTVAITDHNRIDFAANAQAKLGDNIIVGEEITAREGEIIGLYLHEAIPAGLSALETARRIRKQGGLVYVPHPFETARKGVPIETLNQIAELVDIVETYNGRTLQNKAVQAKEWAVSRHTAQASSSDAHGRRGWGRTASIVREKPERSTLVQLLGTSKHLTDSTGLVGRLYPKLNRLQKRASRA